MALIEEDVEVEPTEEDIEIVPAREDDEATEMSPGGVTSEAVLKLAPPSLLLFFVFLYMYLELLAPLRCLIVIFPYL